MAGTVIRNEFSHGLGYPGEGPAPVEVANSFQALSAEDSDAEAEEELRACRHKRIKFRGGETCHHCGALSNNRDNGWQCEDCKLQFCSAACASSSSESTPCTGQVSRRPIADFFAPRPRAAEPIDLDHAGAVDAVDGENPSAGAEEDDEAQRTPRAEDGTDVNFLLKVATALPALRTMRHVPANVRRRIVPILAKLLDSHAEAHRKLLSSPSADSEAEEARTSRWAWLGPTLLKRAVERPAPAGPAGEVPNDRASAMKRIQARVTQAEMGHWEELLRDYTNELLENEIDAATATGREAWPQQPTQGACIAKASAKLDSCAVRQARDALLEQRRPPASADTIREINTLVAVEAPPQQQEFTAKVCGAIAAKATPQTHPPPTTQTVKEAARKLALAAEPGPSGWRNGDIADVCRHHGGPQTLRAWAGIWTAARPTTCTAALWTAATIAPKDCGPKKPEPGEPCAEPAPRKLRPIALAESLLKYVETMIIDEELSPRSRAPEPRPIGTPDAAAVIVRAVRAWAAGIETATGGAWGHVEAVDGEGPCDDDADVVMPVDLENAYGRAYRAACLESAQTACPRTAAVVAGQWRNNNHHGLATKWARVGAHYDLPRRMARIPRDASHVCRRPRGHPAPLRRRHAARHYTRRLAGRRDVRRVHALACPALGRAGDAPRRGRPPPPAPQRWCVGAGLRRGRRP